MLSRRQKAVVLKKIAMFLAETGLCTSKEYDRNPNRPFGASLKDIGTSFGGWEGILRAIKREEPQLWSLAIQNLSSVPISEPKILTHDPLEALRASTTEK